MQWRYREKRNDQEHHEKASFFHLANFFVLFLRKCPLQFLCCLLYDLLMQENVQTAVHRCSSKTGVLKNFAICTGKNLCPSFFLIKFQDCRPGFLFKNRLQRRCFSVNIAKFLRTPFLWNNSGSCFVQLLRLTVLQLIVLVVN